MRGVERVGKLYDRDFAFTAATGRENQERYNTHKAEMYFCLFEHRLFPRVM
jgi:hypothetical protein